MGYSYDMRNRLCCDGCGVSGGVRKRTCPHKVLTESSRGPRQALPYCYPAALCSACYAKEKATLHKDCKDDATRSQREYDTKQLRLDLGEPMVLAAWGSWAEWVPDGSTGLLCTDRLLYLVAESEYTSGGFIADYPSAVMIGPDNTEEADRMRFGALPDSVLYALVNLVIPEGADLDEKLLAGQGLRSVTVGQLPGEVIGQVRDACERARRLAAERRGKA